MDGRGANRACVEETIALDTLPLVVFSEVMRCGDREDLAALRRQLYSFADPAKKAVLLASDDKITDPVILAQIR